VLLQRGERGRGTKRYLPACWQYYAGTVRVFRQKFTFEDAIGSHACSLEASRRVTNGIPLGSPLFLPVHTVICVQTLKVAAMRTISAGEEVTISYGDVRYLFLYSLHIGADVIV
jgi:hypothetical protein